MLVTIRNHVIGQTKNTAAVKPPSVKKLMKVPFIAD